MNRWTLGLCVALAGCRAKQQEPAWLMQWDGLRPGTTREEAERVLRTNGAVAKVHGVAIERDGKGQGRYVLTRRVLGRDVECRVQIRETRTELLSGLVADYCVGGSDWREVRAALQEVGAELEKLWGATAQREDLTWTWNGPGARAVLACRESKLLGFVWLQLTVDWSSR